MRIGFIFPSSDYLVDPFRGDPHTHFQILTTLEEAFGNSVELLLIDLRGIKREFACYHIPECDIYLYSMYTRDWDEQVSIIKSLREYYPKALHIAGGPHARIFPEETLRVVDSLIIGEGEKTIVRAIINISNNNLQRTYQQTGSIDINQYPPTRRHFLPKSATPRKHMVTLKHREGFEKLLGTTVMFSRGCPYQCHFCAIQEVRAELPGIRFRTPELVEAEIEYLKHEYGIQGLVLHDEICFPLKQEQAILHLEAIGRTNIVWRGQCRVDGITEEIAALAKDSGCVALGLGVESVHQKSLDLINKRTSVEQAKKTIHLLKKHDIEARIYLIVGLPGEPKDIVEQTWTFITETEPDLVYISLFTVRPGTEVFRNPSNFGIRSVTTDWTKNMHLHNRPNERPELTFAYEKETPWGPGLSSETIVDNYLELERRLRNAGLNSFEFNHHIKK